MRPQIPNTDNEGQLLDPEFVKGQEKELRKYFKDAANFPTSKTTREAFFEDLKKGEVNADYQGQDYYVQKMQDFLQKMKSHPKYGSFLKDVLDDVDLNLQKYDDSEVNCKESFKSFDSFLSFLKDDHEENEYRGDEDVEKYCNNFSLEISSSPAVQDLMEAINGYTSVENQVDDADIYDEENLLRNAQQQSGQQQGKENSGPAKENPDDEPLKPKIKTQESFKKRDFGAIAAGVGAFFIPGIGPLVGLAIAIGYIRYRSKNSKSETVDPNEQEIQDLMKKIDANLQQNQESRQEFENGPQQNNFTQQSGPLTHSDMYTETTEALNGVVEGARNELNSAKEHAKNAENAISGNMPMQNQTTTESQTTAKATTPAAAKDPVTAVNATPSAAQEAAPAENTKWRDKFSEKGAKNSINPAQQGDDEEVIPNR